MDQRNAFLQSIEDDGVVLGARASTFSPALVEIYGDLGLDFVWLDFEHSGESPWDTFLFENLTRAAELGGTELLVRLPEPNPSLVRNVLDAGVRNLLIPRIDDVEQVRRMVEATRFVYDGGPGERGMASGRSSSYGEFEDYTETEDENVCLGVMIEKMGAVESLNEIFAVPGLSFVFIGPGDLSVQLGHPGEKEHPEVQETVGDIVAAGREAGVPVGGIAHDGQKTHEYIQDGYQVIRMGGEFESAKQVLGDRLATLRELQE